MKSIAALVSLGSAFVVPDAGSQFLKSSTNPVETEFVKYMTRFGKSYLTQEEYDLRLGLFAKTHFEIMENNMQNKSFELGHNKFSDWTDSERRSLFHEVKIPQNNATKKELDGDKPHKLPDSLDWTKQVFSLAMVKDQEMCGAGWAFASIGALDAAAELQEGISGDYSAQQLIDCAVQHGCTGDGDTDTAFSYLKQAGAETSMDYPYEASENQCSYNKDATDPQIKILAAEDLPGHDAHYLKEILVLQGPVTVVLSAGCKNFQQYSKGVLSIADSCIDEKPDHFGLAVGYGTENGKDYLLVRNSFGPFWGENGNIKLEMTATQAASNGLYWISQVLMGF